MKTTHLFIALCMAILLLLLAACLLLPESTLAQGGGAPPPPPGSQPQMPIDGGLALLGAAGGAYAIKKLRDRKE